MPKDALPIPKNTVDASRIRLTRRYADLIGRPLKGNVTITGEEVTTEGVSVVLPNATTVPLANGVLDVHLPPGRYTLVVDAYTVDRVESSYTETVTLTHS